jgi:cysteinyl-tRNA synthetase
LELVGLGSVAEVQETVGSEAEALMAERERARAEKDFERADAIRDRLAALGWEVRDSAEGPRLVART